MHLSEPTTTKNPTTNKPTRLINKDPKDIVEQLNKGIKKQHGITITPRQIRNMIYDIREEKIKTYLRCRLQRFTERSTPETQRVAAERMAELLG